MSFFSTEKEPIFNLLKKIAPVITLLISIVNIALADTALVDIQFDLNNITITKDRQPTKGEGVDSLYSFYVGELFYINAYEFDMRLFPKKIDKYRKEIRDQSKVGRRVIIKYNIINYQPVKENLITDDFGKGYILFGLGWFVNMLKFKFKADDNTWKKGFCRPQIQYFESPSSATVVGKGDFPVRIPPGLKMNLKRKLSLFDIDKVIKGRDYKVLIHKYPIDRSLYISLNDADMLGQKLNIMGKATLGDSVIVTERNAFWYPFDEYSLSLAYISYYPARVTFNMDYIEDLDLSSRKKIEFSVKTKERREEKIDLYRKNRWNTFFLPIMALLPMLIPLFFETIQKKPLYRIIIYVLALLLAFFPIIPTPKNVHWLMNLLSITTILLYCALMLLIEFHLRAKFHANAKLG